MKWVDAIILAAGASRRMGEQGQKLLLDFGGRPMLACVVENVLPSQIRQVCVVTGSHHAPLTDLLAAFPEVHVARNPDPARGMLSSVRCGLQALEETSAAAAEGIAVFLGDQPMIPTNLINAVIEAWRNSGTGISMPVHKGKRGHPLIFHRRFCEAILTDFDEIGLRGLARRFPEHVVEVATDTHQVLQDIDSPTDYVRLREEHLSKPSGKPR